MLVVGALLPTGDDGGGGGGGLGMLLCPPGKGVWGQVVPGESCMQCQSPALPAEHEKRVCHVLPQIFQRYGVLKEELAQNLLLTLQWYQATGYAPPQWIHGTPKPNQPALPENTGPLTMLTDRTSTILMAILIKTEGAMLQWIPWEQTGFMGVGV